jgi:hypothetical protein
MAIISSKAGHPGNPLSLHAQLIQSPFTVAKSPTSGGRNRVYAGASRTALARKAAAADRATAAARSTAADRAAAAERTSIAERAAGDDHAAAAAAAAALRDAAAAGGGLAGVRACAERLLGEDAGAAEAEVLAFAAYLGIDPAADADLLWIAFDAAAAPLPRYWSELRAPDGAPYYQCMRSGRTQVDSERSRS